MDSADINMLSTHPATKERADNAMHRSDKYLVGVYRECTKESRCPKKEQWDTMLSLEASQKLRERLRMIEARREFS